VRWIAAAVLLLSIGWGGAAVAVQPDEVLANPQLESRARALSRELRCMVCQNQSIDDSDAPLARDLRILVRERLAAGDSDGPVLDFLVKRYGEFVLLRPRMEWHTALLWFTPLLVLLAGGLAALLAWRRSNRGRRINDPVEALTEAEQDRLAQLGAGRPDPGH
jgi:cytochrome c-type biogenesis protein CcmH